ncbi:MerR family transcriptional regulator [Anaerolentibacter hominis]|uniref:MerR family transcriptional regulator n=1 Tax=Anaerolentibacter hominis TaxID=3079009 RepID=UPI0031B87A8A
MDHKNSKLAVWPEDNTRTHGTHFKTSEFARLCGTTKHTLYHYDELGIFSPAVKLDNGYRYYSLPQLEVFHVIAVLKELDMPLNEIKEYLNRRTPGELVSLLEKEEVLLEKKIAALMQTRERIQQKASLTRQAMAIDTSRIRVEQKKNEYMLVTKTDPLCTDRDWAVQIANHVAFCNSTGIDSPYAIGSMIEQKSALDGQFEQYCYFYTRVDHCPDDLPCFIKPAGSYLTGWHQDGYGTLPDTYHRILRYAREHRFTLIGYFYEDTLLDDLSVKGYDNYLLQISIRIEDKPF